MAQTVKNLPLMWKTRVWSLDQEDPLKKVVATHSSILPGKLHRQRSLAGYSPWGHKKLDTTEWLTHTHTHTHTHTEKSFLVGQLAQPSCPHHREPHWKLSSNGRGLWATLHERQAAAEKLQHTNGSPQVLQVENQDARVWKPWQSPSTLMRKAGRAALMTSNLQIWLTLYLISTKPAALLTAKEPKAGTPRDKLEKQANWSN